MKRTLYEVLGVPRKATAEDIAAAWQKLSASNPDQAAPALAREAHRVLSDPARRTAYDASLAAAATRALASDGTGRPARAALWGKSSSGLPMLAAVVFGVAVAIGLVLWQARKPAGIEIRELPGSGAPALPALSPEQLFARLSGSVAMVTARRAGGGASGSGVVIERGVVITNCHVTQRGSEITVKAGGQSLPASLLVADEAYDLCKLGVSGLEAAPVTIGSVADLRTGQKVYAIGAPQGLELSLSDGIVSSLREIPSGTVIQTTAPISPGSSGGGLFDASGRLVGIMTFQHRFGQNLNFAVPADWIGAMRARAGSGRASAVMAGPDAPGASVVGRWSCFGSQAASGEWQFEADGSFIVRRPGASPARGRYELRGRLLQTSGAGEGLRLEVESVSRDRMVLDGGGGNRVACERH